MINFDWISHLFYLGEKSPLEHYSKNPTDEFCIDRTLLLMNL